jgi:AcrR family transcriptional regulator
MRVAAGGLSERKMQRTRRELAKAAAELFIERGYDATTVEDIVAVAEVSPRTFYRYFPAKEDVVLALGESRTDALLAALGSRPAGEAPLQAVQAAVADAYTSGWGDLDGVRVFLVLLRDTPALRARWLIEREADQEKLAGVLAEREGVQPGLCHRVAATAVVSAVATALNAWLDRGEEDPRLLVREALALLGEPLLESVRP